MCVARILIGINNKNPESDIGVNTKDQRRKVASHLRVLTSTNAQTKGAILSSDCTAPRAALSSYLLPPYIPLSAQPYHSCLHLHSAGIKGIEYQVLGSPLCELYFSFQRSQSHVAPGGRELTEIPLFLSPSPESWD